MKFDFSCSKEDMKREEMCQRLSSEEIILQMPPPRSRRNKKSRPPRPTEPEIVVHNKSIDTQKELHGNSGTPG